MIPRGNLTKGFWGETLRLARSSRDQFAAHLLSGIFALSVGSWLPVTVLHAGCIEHLKKKIQAARLSGPDHQLLSRIKDSQSQKAIQLLIRLEENLMARAPGTEMSLLSFMSHNDLVKRALARVSGQSPTDLKVDADAASNVENFINHVFLHLFYSSPPSSSRDLAILEGRLEELENFVTRLESLKELFVRTGSSSESSGAGSMGLRLLMRSHFHYYAEEGVFVEKVVVGRRPQPNPRFSAWPILARTPRDFDSPTSYDARTVYHRIYFYRDPAPPAIYKYSIVEKLWDWFVDRRRAKKFLELEEELLSSFQNFYRVPKDYVPDNAYYLLLGLDAFKNIFLRHAPRELRIQFEIDLATYLPILIYRISINPVEALVDGNKISQATFLRLSRWCEDLDLPVPEYAPGVATDGSRDPQF